MAIIAGSVFRKLVGDALMARTPSLGIATWGDRSSASREVRDAESSLEGLVSRHIGEMAILFLPIGDAPGSDSLRGFIERNSISVLSGYLGISVDPPSREWLGRYSSRERVKRSGLWNSNHVDESTHPQFLDVLRDLVSPDYASRREDVMANVA